MLARRRETNVRFKSEIEMNMEYTASSAVCGQETTPCAASVRSRNPPRPVNAASSHLQALLDGEALAHFRKHGIRAGSR